MKKTKNLVQGKYVGSTRGFGFVTPAAGGADVFIPPHLTNGALDGDSVTCKIIKEEVHDDTGQKCKTEGKITEIVARTAMVGAFFTRGKFAYVRPLGAKVPYVFEVPPKTTRRFALADGMRVLFMVDKHHNPARDNANCQVLEVIGHINDPGVDVLSLLIQAGVPYEFDKHTIAEANALPQEVSEAETAGRLDLRSHFIFTIDGDDTKDIDDAISFEETPYGGYKLGVHIADVSHYVEEGSHVQQAALARATSIYLADRVVPMLPHSLSSGICSLLPGVDRLTLSCMMEIDPQGNVVSHNIATSIINSQMRWTYDQVQAEIDTGTNPIINAMDKLRAILRNKRELRGALDFDLPEAKISLCENGKPIAIEPRVRNQATGIIEEFMILCNETIAAQFLQLEAPFVYRTHEAPSEEKLARLSSIVSQFGFTTPHNSNSPLGLQRLLKKTSATNAAQSVATAVLHSLPQANYTPHDATHYGLASQAYCHFTSPIRRYADLQVHRIIKAWLAGKSLASFHASLPEVCATCSHAERVAEVLEREVAQLKKVQFMEPLQGQNFDATVRGVTAWGVYVSLPNTIEGIVPVENLRRFRLVYNKEKGVYVGKKKQLLAHGTPVKVRLVSALPDEGKLVFALLFPHPPAKHLALASGQETAQRSE